MGRGGFSLPIRRATKVAPTHFRLEIVVAALRGL
jgi:hypothetical protein